MSDERELKAYVKSIMIAGGASVVNDAHVQEIVSAAGSNLVELKKLAIDMNPIQAIEGLVKNQVSCLRKLKLQQKKAYELLLKIEEGAQIYFNKGDDDHILLLSRYDKIDAFCGVHPSGRLILAMPVTEKALLIIRGEMAW